MTNQRDADLNTGFDESETVIPGMDVATAEIDPDELSGDEAGLEDQEFDLISETLHRRRKRGLMRLLFQCALTGEAPQETLDELNVDTCDEAIDQLMIELAQLGRPPYLVKEELANGYTLHLVRYGLHHDAAWTTALSRTPAVDRQKLETIRAMVVQITDSPLTQTMMRLGVSPERIQKAKTVAVYVRMNHSDPVEQLTAILDLCGGDCFDPVEDGILDTMSTPEEVEEDDPSEVNLA